MKIDFNVQKFIEDRIGKITPVKVVLGLAAFVIIVNILGLIIGIFQALLPVAVLAVVGYFGYQLLQSRTAADAVAKAKQDTVVEKTVVLEKAEVNRQKVAAKRLAEESETVVATAETETADEATAKRLAVEEMVNPDTGLRETDLAQLEAMEQAKLRQSGDATADAVKAALEERKKRLLGGN